MPVPQSPLSPCWNGLWQRFNVGQLQHKSFLPKSDCQFQLRLLIDQLWSYLQAVYQCADRDDGSRWVKVRIAG